MLPLHMADTFLKRKKQQARDLKKREKEARLQERREEKAGREPLAPGEDPDIAGIRPGPQPKPEW